MSGTGVKNLLIDGNVQNSLNLNYRELSTTTNTVFVQNASINAVTRTSGFVSLGSGSITEKN